MSFEAVKKCYKSLPETIREKYTGRFTPIIDELEYIENFPTEVMSLKLSQDKEAMT